MKPKTFVISASIAVAVAGIIIWNIIDNYYERQENRSPAITEITMYKNPGCQCCDKWATYLERNGFEVTVHESANLTAVKEQHGVPGEMSSCHTALIGNYVVEGHVPAGDINRLINEEMPVKGIAAPGMPASSPGMNTALNEPFDVYLFDSNGNTQIFARH